MDGDLESFIREGAEEMASGLDLLDLNVVLYRCESEERDYTGGDGVYHIPNHGSLVYAGLEGWLGPLQEIINDNNLAHPISENLRQGQWALDYSVNRLYRYTNDFPILSHMSNGSSPVLTESDPCLAFCSHAFCIGNCECLLGI